MRRDFTQGAFLLRIGFFGQYLKAILGTISCLSDNLSFDHATMTVEECPLSLYPGGGGHLHPRLAQTVPNVLPIFPGSIEFSPGFINTNK